MASTASVPEGYGGLSSAGSTVQCLYFAETLPFLGEDVKRAARNVGGHRWVSAFVLVFIYQARLKAIYTVRNKISGDVM